MAKKLTADATAETPVKTRKKRTPKTLTAPQVALQGCRELALLTDEEAGIALRLIESRSTTDPEVMARVREIERLLMHLKADEEIEAIGYMRYHRERQAAKKTE